MATVAGPASPPTPLVVARSEAVVPCAIGQHELDVRFHGGDDLLLHWFVIGQQTVECERRQRLFDVVAHVHRPAAFGRHAVEWMTFSEEKPIWRELGHDFVRQGARAIEVVGLAQDLPAELKASVAVTG